MSLNYLFSGPQETNAALLVCVLQFWYQHKQVRDSRHHLTHELSDAYKPQDGGIHYGEMEVAEVNLADMNPEDIRVSMSCKQFCMQRSPGNFISSQ